MIVCLCHRISDRDIRRAVQGGVRDFETLQDETCIARNCGCCHDCAHEVFDAACAATPNRRSVVPIRLVASEHAAA
jgi:bacterioferritin-associated ferredoxin